MASIESPESVSVSKGACCEEQLRDWLVAAEKSAQKEPVKTVSLAFLAGLVLAILPFGRIAGSVTGVAFSLLRPLLLALGTMKALEEIEKRR
jgi:hypothetical protein